MRLPSTLPRALLRLVPLLSLLASCSEGPTAAPGRREVVVFAAASLRDAFRALAPAYRAASDGAELTFNFAGSQELRAQIEHGAPADLFASADTRHIAELEGSGYVEAPQRFARNEPVVVVAVERANELRAFADLPSVERIVLGAPEVPIGRYSAQILARANDTLGADFAERVFARVVSRELNVRQVLAKVSLGEAHAAIVYRSDAQSARGAVHTVAIPKELNVLADYSLAVVKRSAQKQLAARFIELVRSASGQRELARLGFLPLEGSR